MIQVQVLQWLMLLFAVALGQNQIVLGIGATDSTRKVKPNFPCSIARLASPGRGSSSCRDTTP